ncbi:hypothetical protein [Rhizobium sp. BK399]|uniref:hypothetical protein n=1 Tax=Rhizobium sp. BK399 TaxID=2587063 RepID=UPI00160EDD27|nr:hypothetical protein [Rhizobium sp. BK399]MBB3542452.1 hypothetical protein [Rhizobium sp. BK399]
MSSVLIASSLSMVQWQNLLWGFQTEFYLVLIGAVFSLICALRLSESTKWQGQARWFGALVSATAFSVFSMASGFALPISIVIFFILVRYSRRGLLLFSLIGVLLIAVDLMLTRDPPVVGDAALRTPLNMAVYFFSMMGGPFSSNLNSSVTAGAVAFFILVAAFTRYAAVPWLKGKPVDKVSAALFALCSFLCASAAAASYGRTPMGVESALSSRYSTPMLLLIMTISLVLIRQAMLKCQKYELQPTKFTLLLFLMVTCVGLTTFRNNAAAYSGFVKWSTRAAYFVASGVDHESQLKSLFPNAAAIRPALEMLRNQKLNIFATWGGLPMPSANQVLEGANIPSDQVCSRSAVDSITQLSLHQWQASGWAADEEGRSPAWILAFDQNGRLLGFTKPLEDRPDVTKAIGAEEGFQGFLIPVSGSDSMKKPVALVVIYGDEKPPCRIRAPSFPE